MDVETEERFIEIENSIENLFYSLIGARLRKPTIEEIVELAVLEYFNVTRKNFLGQSFVKQGRTVQKRTDEDKAVIEARKWFISLMRYVLQKTTYSLTMNYPFYHTRKEHKHRPVFTAALDPVTEQDKKHRKTLLGISKLVKDICKVEGVLDEDFQGL